MVRAGQKLHDERVSRGLTIEEVAKATKIRSSYLLAIEKGMYKELPSSAYVLGFVKNYASFLGLPQKETVAIFRREFNEQEFLGVLPKEFSEKTKSPKVSQRAIFIFFAILCLIGYLFLQYRIATANPPLSVSSPKEGQKITGSAVTVSGTSDPNATILINDNPVAMDGNGSFTKKIPVFSGSFIIKIKAQSRFGKETEIDRHIEVTSS